MPWKEVEHPIPGPKAFTETSDAALLSQTALLLLLGWQLPSFAAGREWEFADPIPAEDLEAFPVPSLRRGAGHMSAVQTQARLVKRYGTHILEDRPVVDERPEQPEVLFDLAKRLYQDPDLATAAELMEACLHHPYALPRLAAAISYFRISDQPRPLLEVMENALYSNDELDRDLAATALARVAPDHPLLAMLTQPRGNAAEGGQPLHTALLVHGTFARTQTWWQPGGDFHSYLLGQVRPDLYSGADRFDWSGGYKDDARSLAASDLHAWVNQHGAQGLDLFAHSHGGSVAMLASKAGMKLGKLVLLSCPVHVPKYEPNFQQVQRVISIRVRLDLVILADGGGQRFSDPRIEENVLPSWFLGHSATHDPAVWQKYNVPAMV